MGRPVATGMAFPNFSGVDDISIESVRNAYKLDDLLLLQQAKTRYDPSNLFRINFNIPPKGTGE